MLATIERYQNIQRITDPAGKEFKAVDPPPNSPDLNLSKQPWNMVDKQI